MSKQLGPLEIFCDAPPFCVVQECQRFEFHSPLDVCWLPVTQFLVNEESFLDGFPWTLFFGKRQPKTTACGCGASLPVLETYIFPLASGQVVAYRLGQCRRCWTMFWEEVTHDYVD